MARTEGSRNQTYEARRGALLANVRGRLSKPCGSRASLRELAEASGVSLPTLRHYFPQREDLILALMAEDLADGRPHLAHVATPSGPFAASIREVLGYIAFGFDHGVGEVHTVGLTEGLRHSIIGPAFVDLVLEPSIDAVKDRLDAHVEAGEMRNVDTRHAALTLLSPVVLLMLHQGDLGGASNHLVELESFLDNQADGFVRAYSASSMHAIDTMIDTTLADRPDAAARLRQTAESKLDTMMRNGDTIEPPKMPARGADSARGSSSPEPQTKWPKRKGPDRER